MCGQSLQSQPCSRGRLALHPRSAIVLLSIPIDDFRTSWITGWRPRRNAFSRNVVFCVVQYEEEEEKSEQF